jgi:hypothetical protein
MEETIRVSLGPKICLL